MHRSANRDVMGAARDPTPASQRVARLLLACIAMSARDESDEAGRLFREAIGSVRPLKVPAEHADKPAQPAPEPTQFLLDEARVRDELLTHTFDPATIEVGDEINYLKSGQSPDLLKRLRRGQFSVRAEIDLHEMTRDVARGAIREFLEDSHRHGELCVRIVHGKGLRSKAHGPVLKQMTDALLRHRDDVLAFASAQGGTGAVIVLLQRR